MEVEELHEILNEKIECLFEKVDRIHDKLFVDDDGKSIQSKVNQNSRWIKVVTGVLSAVGLAVLGIVGWIVKERVLK